MILKKQETYFDHVYLYCYIDFIVSKCFLRDNKKIVVWKLKNSGSTNTVQITH